MGVDPGWHGTRTELPYLNSLKMKMSIILGGRSVPSFPSSVSVLLVFFLCGRRVRMGPWDLCLVRAGGMGKGQGVVAGQCCKAGRPEGAPELGRLAYVMRCEHSRRCSLHCKLPL